MPIHGKIKGEGGNIADFRLGQVRARSGAQADVVCQEKTESCKSEIKGRGFGNELDENTRGRVFVAKTDYLAQAVISIEVINAVKHSEGPVLQHKIGISDPVALVIHVPRDTWKIGRGNSIAESKSAADGYIGNGGDFSIMVQKCFPLVVGWIEVTANNFAIVVDIPNVREP